ncbi:MAG: ribbon-helix-helix protein, CopG family [Gemmatimonadota bacterium]|nr:ribbon-helix-helix protein, CopG family [Gemmatimonadota bacterium]MDH3423173.1 ribbon-helix-helix protein, CopG family [Gemmatimonadota bacterium]
MSTRLQVVLDEEELEEIRRAARRHRLTVSEWVRQALRESRRAEPRRDEERKLEVVREAAEHAYPVGDIGEMLRDIESGYLGDQE